MLTILLITAVFGFMLAFSESVQAPRLASLSYEEARDWWGCLNSEVWGDDEEQGASSLGVDPNPVLLGLAVTFGPGAYDLKGSDGER